MNFDVDDTPRPKAETIILEQNRQIARIDGAFLWPPIGGAVKVGGPNRDLVVVDVWLLLTDSLASVCIDVCDPDEIIPSASEGDG